MDSVNTQSSKTWGFCYDIEVFPDSFYVEQALQDMFKDMRDVQWIAVLDDARGHAPSAWICWVRLPVHYQQSEIDKLVLGRTFKGMPAEPDDTYIGEEFIPEDIIVHCIEGNPYVQHNIPVDWKIILKNVPGTWR